MDVIKKQIDKFMHNTFPPDGEGISCQYLDDALIDRHIEYGRDDRLREGSFIESSISLGCFQKENNTLIAATSLLFIQRENFRSVRFWRLDHNNKEIINVPLDEVLNAPFDFYFTIGFTKSNQTFPMKIKAVKFFINLVKYLLNENKMFLFIECTGCFNLPKQVRSYPKLSFDELSRFNKIDVIGKTYDQGATVEKFCQHIGMSFNNLYNLRTLGKVYLHL